MRSDNRDRLLWEVTSRGTERCMLDEVTDNCLYLLEHHKMDGDRDRVDLWYRNITHP